MDETRARTRPPDSEDVIAVCEFLKVMAGRPLGPERHASLATTAHRIFDAWVKTLDLGES
jgi:hypothetical protein